MNGLRTIILAAALIGLGLNAAIAPPAVAQSSSARAALDALAAFSEDDEWTMDGKSAAERVLQTASVASLRAAADGGNMRATWMLGHVYYFALAGTPANNLEAVRLWRAAADAGNLRAQNDVAWMYSNGAGTPQNYADAAHYYGLAAAQNHAAAQVDLGVLYENGHGVPQDYAEAARLYDLAAASGSALGQNNLGGLYESGHGVTQNNNEALRLYRLSADQGEQIGIDNLARLTALLAEQGGAGKK